jgi:hypothetical protein
MKKLYYIIIIAVGLLFFTSCESYLDQVPRNSLTRENAITDFNKAKAAVAGIYSTFQNDYYAGGLYAILANKAGFFNPSSVDYQFAYTQISGGNASAWSAFYRSLNAANFAINGIPGLSAASIPSEADRTALIAEARCLRAWINLNILWNFGHWWEEDSDVYGLLYRDDMVDMMNVMKPRITVGESYAKIYEDLDFAIENMKDFTSPRYASKQFAMALKAKALLYRGAILERTVDLQAALTLVNQVLTSLPSSCAMEADLAEVYEESWDSKENLFVKYLEDDGTRTSKAGYYYPYGLYVMGYGTNLPLPPGGQATAGLVYGYDWFSTDPRWPIVTGDRRKGETWDESRIYIWSKLYRLGSYQGKVNDPPDEKYASYWLRVPELYIMKSELLARTGATIAEAIAPVNEMRSKRTNPVLPALNPANQEELMELIFKELCMETILENGSEFFASLRFQKDGQPMIVAIKSGLPLEWNKVCWPIPDAEMINNQEMVQNPDLN